MFLRRKDDDTGELRFLQVPKKFEGRVEYIKEHYGDDPEKVQTKLQTLYLFLRTRGSDEIREENNKGIDFHALNDGIHIL